MTSPPKHHRNPDFPAGFSLIELLLVITIIALIATFLVPAISQILASQRLSSAAANFASQLALARQTAISSHLPVEMHIYQLTDNAGASNFTAARLFKLTNAADSTNITAVPFTPLSRLPAGLAIMAQANYSTLVTDTVQTNAESVPGVPGSVPYRLLCFLPNGQADLTVTGTTNNQRWTVTLAANQFANAGTPANFATLALDPLTGKVLVYRP